MSYLSNIAKLSESSVQNEKLNNEKKTQGIQKKPFHKVLAAKCVCLLTQGLKETQSLSIQDILIVKGFAMHYQEISNSVSQLEVYENPLQQGKRMDSLHVTSYLFRVCSTDWKSS